MFAAFCRCFHKQRSDPVLISYLRVLISPNFSIKNSNEWGNLHIIIMTKYTILLHGRQKTENNNQRSWQFKRSIKATQRLTIKAGSPFKDGSKDPFASLLFWRIDLYKFRVKASCFFYVWFVLWHTFLIQFPSCILWWHVSDSQTNAGETALKRSWQMEKEVQAASKRAAGISLKRKFIARINEILVEITTVIIPAQLVTSGLPPCDWWCCYKRCCDATSSRPTTGYLQSFCCTLLQKKASLVQTFYPRLRLFPTFPYRNKQTEMESCFSGVILTFLLEIVGFSGWPLIFLRSA